MASWGHAMSWPHLRLPQLAAIELPGSLLRADYGLPEGRMCLIMSPAHSRQSMCALQNLMKLSSNDFLCESPAATPAPS